jgi:transposase-like protein
VAPEFLAGETLHSLAKRYDLSRNLIRIWVQRFEAGALDEDAVAADLIEQYEARIAALERLAAICEEFECYGWRRVRGSATAGHDRQSQED